MAVPSACIFRDAWEPKRPSPPLNLLASFAMPGAPTRILAMPGVGRAAVVVLMVYESREAFHVSDLV